MNPFKFDETNYKQICEAFRENCRNTLRANSPQFAQNSKFLESAVDVITIGLAPILRTMKQHSLTFDELLAVAAMGAIDSMIEGRSKADSDTKPQTVPPAVHAEDLGATSFPRSVNPGLN